MSKYSGLNSQLRYTNTHLHLPDLTYCLEYSNNGVFPKQDTAFSVSRAVTSDSFHCKSSFLLSQINSVIFQYKRFLTFIEASHSKKKNDWNISEDRKKERFLSPVLESSHHYLSSSGNIYLLQCWGLKRNITGAAGCPGVETGGTIGLG